MRKILFFVTIIVLFNISEIANASTDDAKVLGGLSVETDLYAYLNGYNYRIWRSDHRYSIHDMYINKDDSVIVDVWNGRLGHVYIIKPNYTTDKGIAVGMNLQDIVNTYGQYDEVWKSNSKNYTGYVTIEYVSDSNEGLSFVLNKYTEKIVLIRYQENRHGNTLVMSDVERNNMLPYLR